MPSFIHFYLIIIAQAKIACGKLDEGQAILEGVPATLPADVPGANIITLTLAYGHLHLAQGWPEALFAGLEEQVRPFRKAGFDSLLADEHWLRGRAALALGQFEAARAALVEARVTAEAQEERAVLWQILATLSELEHACDDTAADSSLRDQAWAVVDDIAAHASELQGAFLSQPAVAQLLGESWRS